jgi:hypothetical protein
MTREQAITEVKAKMERFQTLPGPSDNQKDINRRQYEDLITTFEEADEHTRFIKDHYGIIHTEWVGQAFRTCWID